MINKIIEELEKIKSDINSENEILTLVTNIRNVALDDAIEIVKKYGNDGWILCSEELPKNDGNYLTSVSRANPMVSVDYFDTKHRGFDCYADVVAWKPLPQPYNKEVKHEYQ